MVPPTSVFGFPREKTKGPKFDFGLNSSKFKSVYDVFKDAPFKSNYLFGPPPYNEDKHACKL